MSQAEMWETSISEQETDVHTWSCRLGGGFRGYEAWAAKLHLMGGGINNHDSGETGDRWVRRGDSQAKEE